MVGLIIIMVVILALLSLLVFPFITVFTIFSPKTELQCIKLNWNITLPTDSALEYELQSTDMFRGEGIRYNVYSYRYEPKEFLSDFLILEDETIREEVEGYLYEVASDNQVSVPSEYLINWEEKVVYKHVTKYSDDMYMIYSSERKYIYVCQNII